MKDPTVVSTLEMASVGPKDLAAVDVCSLVTAVTGAAGPTAVLQRLTRFLAGRLNASECACLLVDPSSSSRDLIYASDASGDALRGRRLWARALSYEVQALLDRGHEWMDETSEASEGPGPADVPPPVLRGTLTETEARAAEAVLGLVVPLIHGRQVVGILWVGGRRDGEPFSDWDLAVVQGTAALAGSAAGEIQRERATRQAEREQSLEHQRQLDKVESTAAKLRETVESRQRELSIVAHDMRAPLSVIQGHTAMLRNLAKGRETILRSLDSIGGQCDRLDAMIEDLLTERRQRAMALRLEPCDLSPIIQSWSGDLGILAERTGAKLETDIADGLGIRRIDSDKIFEVLANLVDNAAKYSGAGGRVDLSVDLPERERLRFRIGDTGPGLSAEALANGFALFYRDPNQRRVAGTGVGLASVQELVELMGGKVEANNRDSGGALFTVTLPAYLDELATDDTNPMPATVFRVLLIDPDAQALVTMTEALRAQFEVLTARTAREALWLLQQTPVDCAVIDLNPPLMTGFAAATELRKDPTRRHLPVLFTASQELGVVSMRRRGETLEDVLLRPFEPRELVERVALAVREFVERRGVKQGSPRDTLSGTLSPEEALSAVERLALESRARRSPLTILLLDVDDLSGVYREHGDEAGDELLKRVAQAVRSTTRHHEWVARVGTDQFLAALPGSSAAEGKVAADRLRESVARFRAGDATATASVAVVTATIRDDIDGETLLDRARETLAMARSSGGNQVLVWRPRPEMLPMVAEVRRSVLVVDDDVEVLATLAHHLTLTTDFVVHTAGSLTEALEKARSTPPQIAVLDLVLPDGTGFELLSRLRRQGDPALPAIAFTGRSDLATIDQTEEAGFNACFTKTAKLEHLVDEINRWLH